MCAVLIILIYCNLFLTSGCGTREIHFSAADGSLRELCRGEHCSPLQDTVFPGR